MAYEHLALASDVSKRLAANRAASGIDPLSAIEREGLRLPAKQGSALWNSRVALGLDPATGMSPARAAKHGGADPIAAATTPPAARSSAATPAAPATVSALALSLAVQAERAAVAKLFAHPGAKARVGMLCTRLASGMPAASLRAEIDAGKIRTDQELREIVAETVQAAAAASWDQAYDRAFGKVQPSTAGENTVWDKAIANLGGGARTV